VIPFTQFVRPNGRQRPTFITRPAEIEARAKAIVALGYVFEIEELTTGEASMEVVHAQTKAVLCHGLCKNGPAIPATVDDMINHAYAKLFN